MALIRRCGSYFRTADIQSMPCFSLGANGSFSNRAFGSSSFHRFVSVFWDRVSHPGQASLRSHFWSGSVGPLHACVGSVAEHLASSRASNGAAAIFGVIHRPRPVRDDPVIDLWRLSSCGTLQRSVTEFGVVCPHAVHHNSKLAGNSDNGSTAALPPHQSKPPALDL